MDEKDVKKEVKKKIVIFASEAMDKEKHKVDDAVREMIYAIDKRRLRKIQSDMHQCAQKCCDNRQESLESVHHCVKSCSVSVTRAQVFIQSELEDFQNHLYHCALQCHEGFKDRMFVTRTEAEVEKYTREYNGCISKCIDKHVKMIPELFKKMDTELSKGVYEKVPDSTFFSYC